MVVVNNKNRNVDTYIREVCKRETKNIKPIYNYIIITIIIIIVHSSSISLLSYKIIITPSALSSHIPTE